MGAGRGKGTAPCCADIVSDEELQQYAEGDGLIFSTATPPPSPTPY